MIRYSNGCLQKAAAPKSYKHRIAIALNLMEYAKLCIILPENHLEEPDTAFVYRPWNGKEPLPKDPRDIKFWCPTIEDEIQKILLEEKEFHTDVAIRLVDNFIACKHL